jgi:hypothetical protein
MQSNIISVVPSFELNWKFIYNESVVASFYHNLHPKSFGESLGNMTRVEFSQHLRKYHQVYILDNKKLRDLYVSAIDEVSRIENLEFSIN